MAHDYLSWGRVHRLQQQVKKPYWLSEIQLNYPKETRSMLAYGFGRSYGDSCLNGDGVLIDMRGMKRMIRFDAQTGLLECEAGLSLAEIIEVFLPRGWFPPVVPGTKYVTVGGAIANDIHGKNHHVAGTFGCHVKSFKLLRSDDQLLHCSPQENPALFAATIGGLGLTGIIVSAEIQLKHVSSAFVEVETIKMNGLDDYFDWAARSDNDFEYTVAWIDVTVPARQLGRGFFMRGRHLEGSPDALAHYPIRVRPQLYLRSELPFSLVNDITCKMFNSIYFRKQRRPIYKSRQAFDPFFFPLDKIGRWNLAYGRKGFYQYQFAVPEKTGRDAVRKVLEAVAASGKGSFLSVLKSFGSLPSPGLMSFPVHGPTLTMDFSNDGAALSKLFEKLDDIVMQNGGRIYPAKDGRMSGDVFRQGYPRFGDFLKSIDPKFSSSFWRRVV